MKTKMLFLCVAFLGMLASCTKDNSDNGSGNGSSAPLIVGKWKCTYAHYTSTYWEDGIQTSFYEGDLDCTERIKEYRLDGTVDDGIICSYSIDGDNLSECGYSYHIEKLTTTELHYTHVLENENIANGHSIKAKLYYQYKFTKM